MLYGESQGVKRWPVGRGGHVEMFIERKVA